MFFPTYVYWLVSVFFVNGNGQGMFLRVSAYYSWFLKHARAALPVSTVPDRQVAEFNALIVYLSKIMSSL
jgi:hypothetical protein